MDLKKIRELILHAGEQARQETNSEPEPGLTDPIKWPVTCTVGPGLEGAIACETEVGYVNGAKGWLIYRGYDIFDLSAYSTFEEVSYLLLFGVLPTKEQLDGFKKKLAQYRHIPHTLRSFMSFPVEKMNSMAALRMGSEILRHEQSAADEPAYKPEQSRTICSDEDSIPMETPPRGEEKAIYEFGKTGAESTGAEQAGAAYGIEVCYQLIAALPTLAAAIARVKKGLLPIEPDPELSHAGNFLYMMTGRKPTRVEERIMDICLILHADHGMNASTFAAMVVASTLSDFYFSIGAGIAALNGPLHGGANEQVLHMLNEIGSPERIDEWFEEARRKKQRVMGFGHRVYKAYDPRARVLKPLAAYLSQQNDNARRLFAIAEALEKKVISTLSVDKKIFPNVDFYSGIVYASMGIPVDLFTPIFAVSRVSGWSARVLEYLGHNRIFRPRAMYLGTFDKRYLSKDARKDAAA